jgi:hypothetical protein
MRQRLRIRIRMRLLAGSEIGDENETAIKTETENDCMKTRVRLMKRLQSI